MESLIVSRSAVVGPFVGDTLEPADLGFDKPTSLTRWEDGPRVTACMSELLEGLVFTTQNASKQAMLEHANLHASPIKRRPLITLRAPSKAIFKKQLDLVAAYADLRPDRAAEIVAQMTPPVPFWASVVGILPHRHKKTLQLLDLAFLLAVHVHMRFKHIFACSRPVELSPQIQPMIPTPGHGAWPSGHATEAFIVATVLEALLRAANTANGSACREQLQRLAARIAINRTVAGVHFPVDSAVGRLLGTALGEFLLGRSTGVSMKHRGFDGRLFVDTGNEPKDFRLHDALDSGAGSVSSPAVALAAGPMLAWLWQEAVKEWQ